MEIALVCICVVALAAVIVMALKMSAMSASSRSSEQADLRALAEKIAADADRRLEVERLESDRRIRELQTRLDRQAEETRRLATLEFQNLANNSLASVGKTLRDDNSRQLDAILSPLRQQISEFRTAVTDSYVRENAARKSLADQIERLAALNRSIGDEARNLANALKGNSKVQGDWGEMILETLLENAGMKRDINFFTQVTTDASGSSLVDPESGKRQRPDVVVLLPDNHCMIIDSKVSLTAYLDMLKASESADALELKKATERHLMSVRNHINELADKKYQDNLRNAAEHVLMFIPNEGAYFAAIQADTNLWKYAFDRKVVIVSPTHIFSVMQIVAQLWRQENQNRNSAEIAKLGGLLYDRFVGFISEFDKIERQLQSAHDSYAKCRSALSSGSKSVIARAERLRDLGARTNKKLPESYLDGIDADDDDKNEKKED